jgi:hypothetical protein
MRTTPHDLAPLVDHANCCPLETNVQSCKHPHRCSPFFARGITSRKARLTPESSNLMYGMYKGSRSITTHRIIDIGVIP